MHYCELRMAERKPRGQDLPPGAPPEMQKNLHK
jgi:hypothetical protein